MITRRHTVEQYKRKHKYQGCERLWSSPEKLGHETDQHENGTEDRDDRES